MCTPIVTYLGGNVTNDTITFVTEHFRLQLEVVHTTFGTIVWQVNIGVGRIGRNDLKIFVVVAIVIVMATTVIIIVVAVAIPHGRR